MAMEETKFKSPEYHFNQWIGYGRLARDAQPAANGQPYVWLEVWVNTQMPGKKGEQGGWKEQFIRCQRWNPSEDFLKWAKRNRKVFIVGRLEGYRDDSGKIQMQVNVDVFRYMDTPGSTQNGHADPDPALLKQVEEMETYINQMQDTGLKHQNQYRELVASYEELQQELTKANQFLTEAQSAVAQRDRLEQECRKLQAINGELRKAAGKPVKPSLMGQKRATAAPAGKGKARR
jgi:hypothetical protein